MVDEAVDTLLLLLAPMTPHLAAEAWERRHGNHIHLEPWPVADPTLLVEETVTMVVQVNGKVRDRIEVVPDVAEEEAVRLALASPPVVEALGGGTPRRVIVRTAETGQRRHLTTGATGVGDYVGDDVGDDRDERPRRRRLRAQMLSGAAAHTPEAVVGRLLAVQAQDGRGFRLAVRSRSRGLTAADVDSALGDARLVVTWLNRGTLHLVRTEDYRWLHRLTAHRVLAAGAVPAAWPRRGDAR